MLWISRRAALDVRVEVGAADAGGAGFPDVNLGELAVIDEAIHGADVHPEVSGGFCRLEEEGGVHARNATP